MRVFSTRLCYDEWAGDCLAKNQSKTLFKEPFRSYLYIYVQIREVIKVAC
jgi:hypothetical protein